MKQKEDEWPLVQVWDAGVLVSYPAVLSVQCNSGVAEIVFI